MAYIMIGSRERAKRRKVINESIAAQEKSLKRKQYEPSKWCREMVNEVKRGTDSNGKFKPGSVFVDQINNRYKKPDTKNFKSEGIDI